MTTKPTFMSAPRPNARLTPEDAKRLIDASADLRFARPTRDESTAPQALAEPAAQTRRTPKPNPFASDSQTLRFDVSKELWTALKLESVHRRVTVKYLLLEALHKAGYAVDLDRIPEDGRRLR